MDIKLFLLSVICIIVGIIVMIKHKFYKYPVNDMLFATKLGVFLGGFLFVVIGGFGVVTEVLKL